MDLNGLLRLVFLEKSDLTVGVLIGLTLLVVVLMLVRSVMEEKQSSATGAGAPVDAKALSIAVEGALKKALAETTVLKTSAGSATVEGASLDVEELTKTLREREAKIASLVTDFEALKKQSEAKPDASVTPSSDNSAELTALQAKIKELQAKLSEYEIIEDDIADLSIFKEENKKLKDEIEKLRAATLTAQVQVQSVQASVETPNPSPGSVQAAQTNIVETAATALPSEPQTEPQTEPQSKPEAFQLDPEDGVMGEFAEAISINSAVAQVKLLTSIDEVTLVPEAAEPETPAAASAVNEVAETEPVELASDSAESDPFGPVDTDKMLAEVSSLGDGQSEVSTSVLEDELDTDRLMAEMGISESATTEPSAKPEIVELQAQAEISEAPSMKANQVPVDDLLAEFTDTDFSSLKGTKGS